MKGYGIYVKNDLLEPKHYKAMGQSIWLYLWLLDKMTSVSENGTGKVLGGSPIKLETIAKDLPMSDRSFTRYVDKLEQSEYITALRTPYGYIFTVTKAKKKFGREMERTVNVAPRTVNVAGENRKCGGNKEDSTVDSTIDITEPSSEKLLANQDSDMGFNKYADDFEEELQIDPDHKPKGKEKKKVADEIQQVFDLFDNPARPLWRLREIERVAAQALFDAYGLETIQKRVQRIEAEKKINGDDPYFPLVTTPSQLLDKMEAVERYLKI